jgi:hypothetical protein
MASSFTWIDHSEAERRRMLDALELFRERGTRDELGLASVRDAFADLMFPGTGSLQRRARYFFFVPWMFQSFEAERVPSTQIARRTWQFEVKLINSLAESGDTEGVIGIQKRERLQRFPSSIYWNGLRRLGIRLFSGTPDDYYRGLDTYYQQTKSVQRDDDGEPVQRILRNWRAGLPPMPAGFPDAATTRLTTREADYLAERILAEAPSSIFAFFVSHFDEESELPFVWEHKLASELPDSLKQQVTHARNFAEIMQGASILYNMLLARMPPHREELLGELEDVFGQWRAVILERRSALLDWDRAEMWRLIDRIGVRITRSTTQFVDTWIDFVREAPDPDQLLSSTAAAEVITLRERRLKRRLARLTYDDARERWNGNSGLGRLEYRWASASMVLNDIVAGRRAHARTA